MNAILLLPGRHWYCSFCNDVQIFRVPVGRWDRKVGEVCPTCHNASMNWVKAHVSHEDAAIKFEQIRKAIE
jgi:hypothetical protein